MHTNHHCHVSISLSNRIHGLVRVSRRTTGNNVIISVVLSQFNPVRPCLADRRHALRLEDDFLLSATNDGNQVHEVNHCSWTLHH